jgi:ABC-type nitrate/sulfonate/bicarbonate transport system substrate-binding protein
LRNSFNLTYEPHDKYAVPLIPFVAKDSRPFWKSAKHFPSFPFVVVVANRQKLKSKPAEIVSLLKGICNSIDLIQSDGEKVLAAAAKKEPCSDINVLRRSLSYTVHTYSNALTKRNIEALLYAAKISPAADRRNGKIFY